MMKDESRRDSWNSKLGFIVACIGSAVGMGNLWLFPSHIANYGGTFLLLYVIFTIAIGYTGLIGELAFGRRAKGGPIEAFGKSCEKHKCAKVGKVLGAIPVISSLMLAIGYAIVCSWILRYAVDFFVSIFTRHDLENLGMCEDKFNEVAQGNGTYILFTGIICLLVLLGGISNGIEKTNKILVPIFFSLMIFLIVYIAVQPDAYLAYRYMFSIDVSKLKNPMMWLYALGQSFFSLSLAGSGTIIYGSYLPENIDIISVSKRIVFFDSVSSVFATMMIVPAMAINGEKNFSGGPGLMFIYLPNVFAKIRHGNIIATIFFLAALFAGLTSLINLFETPVSTIQGNFKLSRVKSTSIIIFSSMILSMLIQSIVSNWMNFVSVYLCPIGAFMAAVMFAWVWGKSAVENEISKNHKNNIQWYYPVYKYVFCMIVFLIIVIGIFKGAIG